MNAGLFVFNIIRRAVAPQRFRTKENGATVMMNSFLIIYELNRTSESLKKMAKKIINTDKCTSTRWPIQPLRSTQWNFIRVWTGCYQSSFNGELVMDNDRRRDAPSDEKPMGAILGSSRVYL